MTKKHKNLLFIYLNSFSATGGIEQFNACLMKSLYGNSLELNIAYQNIAVLDGESNAAYLPPNLLKGFKGKYVQAVLYSLWAIIKTDIVLLGHINLLVLALWAMLFPSKKVVLVAHGIEVWQDLAWWKRQVLKRLHLILAVSQHTKTQMAAKQGIAEDNIKVFHNTLNPFFDIPKSFVKPKELLTRYKLTESTKILFTLARLSNAEQYKGYDKVIAALPLVLAKQPDVCYLIAGKADAKEQERITKLVEQLGLSNHVKLIGFVKQAELIAHYLLADCFVMPSRGEGFGIVFLEAMACGVPVVAGNADGSVDALQNGELGRLVTPDNATEIAESIVATLQQAQSPEEKAKLQYKMLQYFGFEQFKKNTKSWLNSLL
jgi:phosphatidyl-myo-inositol dimannoside synthase